MKKDLFHYLIILLLLFHISESSILAIKWFPFVIALFLLGINIRKPNIIDLKIINIFIGWIILNIISISYFDVDIPFSRVIIFGVSNLLLPYILFKIIGNSFWDKFEKVVFFLTLISLPLFALNLIFSDFFNSLISIFQPITNDVFYRLGNNHYWSALFYVNAIFDLDYQQYRNCGFMWEAGAFAMMIIWGIIYNWLRYGINLNFKIIVYISALITTFSTAGYFALFILILGNNLLSLDVKKIVLIFVGIFLIPMIYFTVPFLGQKIETYTNEYNKAEFEYSEKHGAIRVNRFVTVSVDLQKVKEYPLGYGVVTEKDYKSGSTISGVNGITDLMVIWGVLVFTFILYLFWKGFYIIDYQNNKKILIHFYTIGMLILIFSNPVSLCLFTYLLLFSPIIFSNRIVE